MTTVVEVLSEVNAILFDFDGPVCDVFAGYPAPRVANDLRIYIATRGVCGIGSMANITDPLEILRWVAMTCPSIAPEVDGVMRTAERKAVQSALPTLYAHDAIMVAGSTGRAVAIVSNNSGEAIRDYLTIHDLTSHVAFIAGRTPGAPELMKPHPDSVERAIKHLQVAASACVFVGDSVTDIEVSHLTGIRSIGYAKTVARRADLTQAGANVMLESMRDLVTALRAGGAEK